MPTGCASCARPSISAGLLRGTPDGQVARSDLHQWVCCWALPAAMPARQALVSPLLPRLQAHRVLPVPAGTHTRSAAGAEPSRRASLLHLAGGGSAGGTALQTQAQLQQLVGGKQPACFGCFPQLCADLAFFLWPLLQPATDEEALRFAFVPHAPGGVPKINSSELTCMLSAQALTRLNRELPRCTARTARLCQPRTLCPP